MDDLKLSFDVLWKIGTVVVAIALMYGRIIQLQSDVAELKKQLDTVHQDQQWTERNLMTFEYGRVN